MTKKERISFIMETLESLYPNPAIPLKHRNHYTFLIAVLSAQCTDERVNKITPYLFERAEDPTAMIDLGVEEIKRIIRPCGLAPRKSEALYNLSKILCEKYQGEIPRTMQELEALPGVGHKTASVVLSQAFGEATFPVDTHIHRLAFRWGLSNGKNVVQTERDLKKIFPKEKWRDLHLQMIYFGREYCPARGHQWQKCPICKACGTQKA